MSLKERRGGRGRNPEQDALYYISNSLDKVGFLKKFINPFKGHGVFSNSYFGKGDFLLEYRGDFITFDESKRRRIQYSDALNVFMFDLSFNGKLWCIDAANTESLARFVNDDHINPNSKMKRLTVGGKPHLCLFATSDIKPGEEISYDYGDSDWPWRNKQIHVQEMSVTTETENTEEQIHVQEMSVTTETENTEEQIHVQEMSVTTETENTEEQIHVQEMSVTTETENTEECQHILVHAVASSLDKCNVCSGGTMSSLRWSGMQCKGVSFLAPIFILYDKNCPQQKQFLNIETASTS
ncbi:histone-lysine N-methyltransferase, H3 lysine-36 specific-like [Esox lucius]|uniref:histone-lysine N-methyltransferase, H3 lysine-36 specific-like n=1 Tax=Esox lucius TaxID=8010 RepID=UPI001476EF1D|nr:histone-lysine N-methyltransferase, H3 lysine-36 specific-like [Esox lucius]XP_034149811.1 histone-lysine N-methyltransferase, H3 lysine-36 specific-like [Esox lucius]